MKKEYREKAKVWLWPGAQAAWHFVYIDKKHAEQIKKDFGGLGRGFGAVPVEVTLGKTKWKTSIFPSKKDQTYILPLKSQVRRAEGVFDGDEIKFTIKIKA